MRTIKTHKSSIYMNKKLEKRIRYDAAKLGLSKNQVMCKILEQYYDDENKSEMPFLTVRSLAKFVINSYVINHHTCKSNFDQEMIKQIKYDSDDLYQKLFPDDD